jgi:hypothetical protein
MTVDDLIFSFIKSSEARSAAPCEHCGETGRAKGVAIKNHLARLFCHDNDKSCYNERRGHYFDEIS